MFLLMVLLPLLSSFLSGLFGSKIGYKGVKFFPFMILMNFILSMGLIIEIKFSDPIILLELMNWFELGILENKLSFSFDLIVCFMLILVNFMSFCVHLYSCSYMSEDPHLPSFISYLSLFTFFMIMLITGSNLIQLFMGWEGVGLCSYLLINFWFSSIQANKSAIKAMIINKMGDMGLLIGMMILFTYSGSFQYSELFSFFFMMKLNKLELLMPLLLMMMGIMGKSAQMGLHMWLPDAMEGPTPVSALIHAATMVTAGVFLLISISPLFEILPEVLILMILMGSLTSFFSAMIGLTQNDFKKVIAYSTCSQLGYMIVICGFSEYALGLFHLINHGFFKALLFLSAGSMIHALSNEQDMSKSGGLKNSLPLSFILILMGSFSLMGLPFLTGFYSKDLILELIKDSNVLLFSFLLCLFSAFLTAFYSLSLMYFTFLNHPQLNKMKIDNIHEGDLKLMTPLVMLCLFSLCFGYTSQFLILGNPFPPLISNQIKFSPLLLSLMGLFLSLLLGVSIKSFWFLTFNKMNNFFYNLSMNLWYFDFNMNKFLISPFLNLGYTMTYKLIDSQMMEKFGPLFFYSFIYTMANKLSKFHSGRLSLYLFLFILLSLMMMIFNFLLIMEKKSLG